MMQRYYFLLENMYRAMIIFWLTCLVGYPRTSAPEPKITNGLFARIIGKISALTILQYVNFINDKPIGRIKYALN